MSQSKNTLNETTPSNKKYDDYIEVFPDLQGTENLLNVTFAPGENSDLQLNGSDVDYGIN
ncbi:hypothetical protein [Bacillus sp. Marseille-P3661]|uniref:hypothetical protein n=1 Tax=Bacillus sp. Marseille-P3661 TaxID=1936234 RepID=UPI000C864224|nr:hypothetical protein [Bacillus sp. Marseille-P3661]